MRTAQNNLRCSALALALSIAALPKLVNAQAQSLTSINKSPSKSERKDSVKDTRAGVTQLIAIALKSGTDSNISSTLALVIGLPKAMPTKDLEIVISQRDNDIEKRACYVVYENVASAFPETDLKRAVCAYIVKIKRSGLDKQMRYFRIDLNGRLEKVVLSQSKFDETGKVIRGSGVKFDQDINSPEVKKTFEQEMRFWLKDWLKKELKASARKTTAKDEAGTPSPLLNSPRGQFNCNFSAPRSYRGYELAGRASCLPERRRTDRPAQAPGRHRAARHGPDACPSHRVRQSATARRLGPAFPVCVLRA